jgi:hypothetical protein
MQHCSGGRVCPCASNVWWYTTIFPGRTGSGTTLLAILENVCRSRFAPPALHCVTLWWLCRKVLDILVAILHVSPITSSHLSHEYDEIDVRGNVKFGTQEAEIWLIFETE